MPRGALELVGKHLLPWAGTSPTRSQSVTGDGGGVPASPRAFVGRPGWQCPQDQGKQVDNCKRWPAHRTALATGVAGPLERVTNQEILLPASALRTDSRASLRLSRKSSLLSLLMLLSAAAVGIAFDKYADQTSRYSHPKQRRGDSISQCFELMHGSQVRECFPCSWRTCGGNSTTDALQGSTCHTRCARWRRAAPTVPCGPAAGLSALWSGRSLAARPLGWIDCDNKQIVFPELPVCVASFWESGAG